MRLSQHVEQLCLATKRIRLSCLSTCAADITVHMILNFTEVDSHVELEQAGMSLSKTTEISEYFMLSGLI